MKILSFSEIIAKQVDWFFYPYIPKCKVVIVYGDAGSGKTTFVLELLARLSKGEPILDRTMPSEPMNIIYQTCEDGLNDTIKPRLEKSGADCSKIFTICDEDSPLSMTDKRLDKAIIEKQAKVLVLDPLQGFLGASVDINRANEVRPVMKYLSDLAEKHKCTIILIGHLNKCSFAKASYRGLGSIDFQAAARSVLLVGRLKDNPETRVLLQIKNSLAPESTGLAFEIDPEKGFQWVGEIELSSDDLLCGKSSQIKALKRTDAENLLTKILNDGRLAQTEIMAKAAELNISKRTLDTAKSNLNIVSTKIGTQWFWELPQV